MLDQVLNVLTLIAWGTFALLIAYLTLRAFQYGGPREVLKVLTTRRVVLAFLVALALSLLSAALVFIEPQQVGMVISLFSRDGYREQPMRSGLHWIYPMAERVVRYPISWQNYTMAAETTEGAKTGNDSIAARTSDGQAVYLDSSVIYRIDPNEVIRVHIDFQDRYVQDFIRPILRGVIRTEVSQFTADEVNSSKRKLLESNLQEILREEFSAKGFVLDRFLLRSIAFSTQYASAIEQKQVAEQERTQREYQAEQMRKLAEGQRDKLTIEAKGRADAAVLEGEAAAKVILLKGQAEAEALKLINEILSKNPGLTTFRYVDKISPGMKVMVVPSNNPLILPLPSLEEVETQLTATPGVTSTITGTLPITVTMPLSPTLSAPQTP